MAQILELEITLLESSPRIWRRVQVGSDITFHELHYIIQFAMGWTNSHLHQFIAGKRKESIQPPFEDDWEGCTNSLETKISKHLIKEKDKILYEYDFGDGWEHEIVVKKIVESDPKQKYPIVTDGGGACPPEDCGGIGGYLDLLDQLKSPETDEIELDGLMTWLGESFDPEVFDIKTVNQVYFKNFKKTMKEWDEYAGWG